MNATLHYPWLVYDILLVGLSWDSTMDGISAVINTSCKHTYLTYRIFRKNMYTYYLEFGIRVESLGQLPQ